MRGLGVVAGILFVASAGCFDQPKIDAGSLKCKSDENCPTGYRCEGATATVLGTCTRSASDGAIVDVPVSPGGEAGQAADGSSIDSSGTVGIDGENDVVAVTDGSSDQPQASDDGVADSATAPGELNDSSAAAPEVGTDVPTTENGGASGSGGAGGATSSGGTTGLGGGGGATSLGGTTGIVGGGGTTTGGIVGSGGLPGAGGVVSAGGVIGSGGTTVPPVDCGPLGGPSNGSVSYLATTVGETATYSCGPGYGPSGSSTRYCLADGSWSGVAPTCVPANCPGLPSPTNGLVSAPTLTFNSTATYSCSTGYNLVGGASRTCQADGTWSGTPPTCPPVDCLALTAPTKGNVNAPVTTYNSTATYSCDTGYKLSDSTARKCQANKTWSGSAPTCNLVDCGKLTDPTNGSVSVSTTTYNSTASYSCASNYDLSGSVSRTCQADGTWSGTAPTCTPKGCPAGTHNGGDGTCVALYTCVTGYHNGGTGKCVVNATCPTDQLTDDTGTCVDMAGVNWTPEGSALWWTSVASSSDGSKLVAAGRQGLVLSTDFGLTWGSSPSAPTDSIVQVASSADGFKLFATYVRTLFTSVDSGATWVRQNNCLGQAVATSADGTRVTTMTFVDSSGYAGFAVFTSIDSGITCTASTNAPPLAAGSIAVSPDGSKQAIAGWSTYVLDSTVWTSSNYGQAWTGHPSLPPPSSGSLAMVTMSTDGGKLAVAGSQNYVYTSPDFGATWTERTGAGKTDWRAMAASADLSKLVLVGANYPIYTSSDGGATWTMQNRAPLLGWMSVASSADGTHIVAVADGNRIYISSGPVP